MRKPLYFLSLAMLFIFGSCEQNDFFTLTNPPESPWLNINEFERAAVSPYNYAFCTDWGGGYFMQSRVVSDAMSDFIYRIPGASANWPVDVVYNRQTIVEADRVVNTFRAAYKAIGISNAALDFYYENKENPYPDASKDDIENNLMRIIGELHFMRAYSYYHLLVTFAPVPVDPDFKSKKILPYKVSFANAEEASKPEYATGEKIYNLVLTDLLKAKQLLPDKYISGKHHPSYQYGRANKFAARALLARVYFRLGEWEKAISELDTIIDQNGGEYNLEQEPFEAFRHDDPQKGKEVIWYALYYDVQKGVIPKDATLFTYLDYRATNGGHGAYHRRSTWHTFSMSNDVAKRIGWMDNNLQITSSALYDKRYKELYWRLEGNCGSPGCGDPEYYDMQYPQVKEPRIWGDKYFRGTDGRFTNVPVIRLAEMYLTRAILRFRMGDLAGAAEDMNTVRRRAWDADASGIPYEASDAYLTSANITEEAIHIERLKEFAYEGDWLIYCENLGLPILPGDRISTSPILPPYQDLYWAIPQEELDFQTN
ncbi:MAG: RagB/SusD family nutrient uptake outer membrane protein [Candidatus Kryptoniota bacterium]